MRIALVAQEYPPETAKGGIGTQAYLKARGLAALRHEVHVISRTATGAPAVRTERDIEGVNVIRIPGFEGRMEVYTEVADWVTYSAAVAAEIAALHARLPLDLVEFPEWGAEGYVHLLNRTEWNYIPTVVQLHGPLVMFAEAMGWPQLDTEFYRTGTAMEGTCVRLADAVYSSSACSAEWCADHYEIERSAIRVLHAGVDTVLFSPGEVRKADRPTIVFAGKLVSNKGVVILVQAAARLAQEFPDLCLQLIGRVEPKMAEQLKEIAEAANAPSLLEFVGFVDRTKLPGFFSRAHVFAMPSPYEPGPGLVYLEAMACGLPVIACSEAGAAEVVRDGDTGLLVPPNDVNGLAEALRGMLGNKARRDVIGAAARQYAISSADSRRCIRQIEEFFVAVATRARGRTLAHATGT